MDETGCTYLSQGGYFHYYGSYYACHKTDIRIAFVRVGEDGNVEYVSYIVERQRISVANLKLWYGDQLPLFRVWDKPRRTFILGDFKLPKIDTSFKEALFQALEKPIVYKVDKLPNVLSWVSWVNFSQNIVLDKSK